MADETDGNGAKEANALAPVRRETARMVTSIVSIQERGKTVRTVVICVASVLIAGMVTWAVVRIYTHEFWIELFSFLLAPTGIVVLFIRWLATRATKKFDKALARITAPQATPTEPPKGKQP
jgi:Flp pilus assembly protein TadB